MVGAHDRDEGLYRLTPALELGGQLVDAASRGPAGRVSSLRRRCDSPLVGVRAIGGDEGDNVQLLAAVSDRKREKVPHGTAQRLTAHLSASVRNVASRAHLVVEEERLARLAANGPHEVTREHAAPCDLAAVDWLVGRRLLSEGEDVATRDRANPVGTDNDVRLNRRAVRKAESVAA